MRLLLIKIGLLNKKGQYAKIKVFKDSKKVEQIKADIVKQEEEISSTLTIIMFLDFLIQASTPISLKRDN